MKTSQRGIALLIVLWVTAILMVMVLSFSVMIRAEGYGTIAFKEGIEKKLFAEAGIERGIMEIVYHSIRPGITGWAQINYPHGATENDAIEKFQYDLFYIKNLSPLLDLRILLRTFYIVLSGRGAR